VIKPTPEAEIAKAVQLLDLMLEFFADDGRWTRGSYDDGNGGHCLVGALLHLSRKHRLPTAPAIALLQDAMPRPGLPLVHFNDSRCGSAAELRSVIVRAVPNDYSVTDSWPPPCVLSAARKWLYCKPLGQGKPRSGYWSPLRDGRRSTRASHGIVFARSPGHHPSVVGPDEKR
jgi:hypothetical protein